MRPEEMCVHRWQKKKGKDRLGWIDDNIMRPPVLCVYHQSTQERQCRWVNSRTEEQTAWREMPSIPTVTKSGSGGRKKDIVVVGIKH